MIGLLVVWALLGAAVGWIASAKGRGFFGWWVYGFLLFPIALIHALVMATDARSLEAEALSRGDTRKCPSCAEVMKAEAKVCRYCGRDVLVAPAEAPGFLG